MDVARRDRLSMSGFYDYDVFLILQNSNRFTLRLTRALEESGFRIFKPGPTDTREAIERAIKESMVSIIVFTVGSMFFEWHLDVLALVLQRKRTHAHPIIPLFYGASEHTVQLDFRDPWRIISDSIHLFDSKFSGVIHSLGNAHTRWGDKRKGWSNPKKQIKDLMMGIRRMRLLTEVALVTRGLLKKYIRDESIEKIIEMIEDKQDTSGENRYSVPTEGSRFEEMIRFDWKSKEVYLINSELSELPKKPCCHFLVELFLQLNLDLTEIPLTFFEEMPILRVLDLSNTSIKSLPPSISRLVELREFYLRGCELLMELSPKIGALGKLKVLDLEGTPLICLPKEIRWLHNLECLKVSLCRAANHYRQLKGIEAIIPRALSGFHNLNELYIFGSYFE